MCFGYTGLKSAKPLPSPNKTPGPKRPIKKSTKYTRKVTSMMGGQLHFAGERQQQRVCVAFCSSLPVH